MSVSKRKTRRDQFRDEEASLRALINEFDIVPGSPEDEYDVLVHRLLSSLHANATQIALSEVVAKYFATDFGVPLRADDTSAITDRVWRWWVSRPQNSAARKDRDA